MVKIKETPELIHRTVKEMLMKKILLDPTATTTKLNPSLTTFPVMIIGTIFSCALRALTCTYDIPLTAMNLFIRFTIFYFMRYCGVLPTCVSCLYILCMQCPQTRSGHQIPWNCSWRRLWATNDFFLFLKEITVCLFVCTHTCYRVDVVARGQFKRNRFFPLSMFFFSGMKPRCQTCWRAPLSTEPSHQPKSFKMIFLVKQ